MSLIQILSYSQKKEFESPPTISDETRSELSHFLKLWSFNFASIDKDINKINFIVMYGYFKLTRTFYEFSSFYPNDIDYISKRYGLQTNITKVAIHTQTRYKNHPRALWISL